MKIKPVSADELAALLNSTDQGKLMANHKETWQYVLDAQTRARRTWVSKTREYFNYYHKVYDQKRRHNITFDEAVLRVKILEEKINYIYHRIKNIIIW